MSRPSSILQHPQSEKIISAIVAGTPVLDISRQFRVSQSAIYRFRGSQFARAILAKARGERDTGTIDFFSAAAANIRDLDAVRTAAMARGDEGSAVRAAVALDKALGTALGRLGLDSTDAALVAAENEALASATLAAIAETPAFADEIVDVLRGREQFDLADEIASFVESLPKRIGAN